VVASAKQAADSQKAPDKLLAAARALLKADADKHAAQQWEAHRKTTDESDARERQDAFLSAASRAESEAFEARVREMEAELAASTRRTTASPDEKRLSDLHKRIDDFRGNDDASLRERLLKEGFPEALTQQELRLRTLDQRTGNELGMRAQFLQNDSSSSPQRPAASSSEPQYLRESEPEPTYQANTPHSPTDAKTKDAEDGVKDALGLRKQYK
jgi:hypothetical protein